MGVFRKETLVFQVLDWLQVHPPSQIIQYIRKLALSLDPTWVLFFEVPAMIFLHNWVCAAFLTRLAVLVERLCFLLSMLPIFHKIWHFFHYFLMSHSYISTPFVLVRVFWFQYLRFKKPFLSIPFYHTHKNAQSLRGCVKPFTLACSIIGGMAINWGGVKFLRNQKQRNY